MATIDYPEQIYKCARTTKTLGIEAKLYESDTANGQSPLEMHSGYSRFVFTILSKTGAAYEFASANLPPSELDLMKKKTEIAVEKLTEKSLIKSTTNSNSSAYTVTFFIGKFKGKTPADVLLDDAKKVDELLAYKKELQANLGRYPRNQQQIDAIDEAVELLNKGELNQEASKSQIIDIYRADVRAPHAKKVDAEGYTDVYSFSIVCDLSKDYPFAVNIMNCKAPVTRNANGTMTPNMKQAKNKKEHSILLTDSEWFKALSRMERTNVLFENSIFDKMLKIARENTFRAQSSK